MCGVIVVDAESIGLLVSDVMPICMIIALDIVMTLRDSINCSTVIRSPTVILDIMREASSEHYGPRVYFTHYIFRSTYKNTKNTLLHFYLFIYLYLPIITIRSHFASNRKGIDNPFIALGASLFVFAQVPWCLILILLLD